MPRSPNDDASLATRFGMGLRRFRKATGMSQAEFAERLGFHPTYIGTLERGQRNVTIKVLERLAAQLEVNPLWLLYPEFVSPTGEIMRDWEAPDSSHQAAPGGS